MSDRGGTEGEVERGFAGLSSMSSELDDDLLHASQTADPESPAGPPGSDAQPPETEEIGTGSATRHPKSNEKLVFFVILGAAAIGLLEMAAGKGGNSGSSTTRGAAPVAPEVAQNRLVEEVPPLGRDRVLNRNQILYCLAEDIRVDAADPLVNTRSQLEVDVFNTWVADFNRRCTNYRYYESAMNAARRQIDSRRGLLEVEGRNRFLRQVGR